MCWLPRWLSGEESTCLAGDAGLIPASGRSPGEGNGNPLQYPCLENRLDRGAWKATVRGSQESDRTERLQTVSVSLGVISHPGGLPPGSWGWTWMMSVPEGRRWKDSRCEPSCRERVRPGYIYQNKTNESTNWKTKLEQGGNWGIKQ